MVIAQRCAEGPVVAGRCTERAIEELERGADIERMLAGDAMPAGRSMMPWRCSPAGVRATQGATVSPAIAMQGN